MKNFAVKTLAAVALTTVGFAAHADNVTMTSTATVVAPITTTVVSQLSFGRFAANPYADRTVVMSPEGVRSGTAALMASDTGTAGVLDVSGEPNASFTVQGNGWQDLNDGSGNLMRVTYSHAISGTGGPGQDPSQGGTGTFDGGGKATVKIGGSVVVVAGRPAGSYTGNRSILLSYN